MSPGEKHMVVSTPLEVPSDESKLRIESDLLENNGPPKGSSPSKKPRISGSGGRVELTNTNPTPYPEGINLDEPFSIVTNPVTSGITPREFLVRKTPSLAPVQQEWTEKCEQIVNVDRRGDTYEHDRVMRSKHYHGSKHWLDVDVKALMPLLRRL